MTEIPSKLSGKIQKVNKSAFYYSSVIHLESIWSDTKILALSRDGNMSTCNQDNYF